MADTRNPSPTATFFTYHNCQIKETFYYDAGIAQLPVADDDRTARIASEIIKLHAGHGVRAVEWKATRETDWPEIPDPNISSGNFVLKKAQLTCYAPVLLETGLTVLTLEGVYWFVSIRPIMPGDIITIATMPMYRGVGPTIGPQHYIPMLYPDGSPLDFQNAIINPDSKFQNPISPDQPPFIINPP